MKAIIHPKYGSPEVLQYTDVDTPTPAAGQVLIQIHASSINKGDHHILYGTPFPLRFMTGLRKPKVRVFGQDFAGEITAVGTGVTAFKPGDRVYGNTFDHKQGAFAEYVVMPADAIAHMPPPLSFEQAAAIPNSAITALQAVRDHGQVAAGQSVLVNGAAGAVGSFALQLAKAMGATVTAVASTSKLDMLRGLGADHVIDYKRDDFTQNGQQYDVIIDAAATRKLQAVADSVKPGGRYVLVGGDNGPTMQIALSGKRLSKRTGKTFTNFLAKIKPAALDDLADYLADGRVQAVIDRSYPLAEAADAMRYVAAGKAHGRVIISVVPGPATP